MMKVMTMTMAMMMKMMRTMLHPLEFYIPFFATLGPRLNIKTVLSMYGDLHVKDKTAVKTSYL